MRKLGDRAAKPAVTGSSGAHITLPEWYGSGAVGMIVPKTKVSCGVDTRAGPVHKPGRDILSIKQATAGRTARANHLQGWQPRRVETFVMLCRGS
jgi:hypothetical protein